MRQTRDSDYRYFWAAYCEGSFDDLLMPDLDPQTFKAAMIELQGAVNYDWTVTIGRPVGLFLGNSIAAGRGVEVQVDWMPWASPRDKLEGTAIFLREISKQLKIFIFSKPEHESFFGRLCRYRMLRNGCTVLNYFGGGEHAKMYYTAGPD